MIVRENNRSLSGGVNTRTAGRLLDAQEATTLLNVDISTPGLRTKRLQPLAVTTLELSNLAVQTVCPSAAQLPPFTLRWIAAAGATGFRVEIFRGAGCDPANLIHTSPDLSVTENSYLAPDIFFDVPPAVYSWHVIALGDGVNTVDSTSDCCQINVGQPPPCTQLAEAVLVSPINGASPTENPVEFVWEAVTNAIGYIVRVYVHNSLSPVHTSPTLPPSQTSYSVTLVLGQEYDWTVQPVGDGTIFCAGIEGGRENFLAGCAFISDPDEFNFGACASGGTIFVGTNGPDCQWTASAAAGWITFTGATSGSGPGIVVFTVSDNNTGVARTGTITAGGQDTTVNQEACDFVVTPTNVNIGACASTGNEIAVSTSSCCTWTAVSNAAWITITGGTPGTGNGVVTYSVSQNSTGAARVGTMTIAGETVTVTQAACSFEISPSGAIAACLGDTGIIDVTATSCCDWTAVSNDVWITITSGATGTGNGSVGWTAAVNSGGSSRTGTITVATITYTIDQPGGCMPPSSCGAGGPYAASYAIQSNPNFGAFCTGQADGPGLPIWDEVFDTRDGSNCTWYASEGNGTVRLSDTYTGSIRSGNTQGVRISLVADLSAVDGSLPAVPGWVMILPDANHTNLGSGCIWAGYKTTGGTPAGTYARFSGCSTLISLTVA